MKAEIAKRIQVFLLLAFVAAGIRLAMIAYERYEAASAPAKPAERALDPDYYVSPPKFYGYDERSAAAELTKQPVWVKVGYEFHYYRLDPATHRADLTRDAGVLEPLERLQITDVVVQKVAGGDLHHLLAVFTKQDAACAVPIGTVRDGDYDFQVNDMFFLKDPHQLYAHWPREVWQAIDRHEAQKGMNQLQVGLAVGAGFKVPGAGPDVLDYPAGGHRIRVVYAQGRAERIQPVGGSSE